MTVPAKGLIRRTLQKRPLVVGVGKRICIYARFVVHELVLYLLHERLPVADAVFASRGMPNAYGIVEDDLAPLSGQFKEPPHVDAPVGGVHILISGSYRKVESRIGVAYGNRMRTAVHDHHFGTRGVVYVHAAAACKCQ